MLIKFVGCLIISALVFFSFLFIRSTEATTKPAYVKLEVRGKLIQIGTGFAIETHDAQFPDMKLLVKLERSEDKNRSLDAYLDELKEKTVLADGFLDCRRIGQEQGAIYLYLSNQSQIIASEEK